MAGAGVRRWSSGSLAALRAALAQPQLRRVQLAWAGSTSGEFIALVALGLFAYEAGGATAVGEDVTTACAAASLIRNASGLLAPALAGVVLLVAGVPALFALATVAFALGALTLLGVGRTDAVRSAPPMAGALHELTSGFRMAARERGVGLVLGLFAAHGVARGSVGVLLVVVPLELLETGEAGVGFLNAAVGSAASRARSPRQGSSAAGRSPGLWRAVWRRPAGRSCSPGRCLRTR